MEDSEDISRGLSKKGSVLSLFLFFYVDSLSADIFSFFLTIIILNRNFNSPQEVEADDIDRTFLSGLCPSFFKKNEKK